MAYTAKCDTATHTKWWVTGTGTAVNRLSEVMDDNASGVEENDNPGNYQPWSEFMTETVEDAVYLIHQDLEIGDGSTSTTLVSYEEYVRFDTGTKCEVQSNATLNIGAALGSYSEKGSFWSFCPDATMNLLDGGTMGVYASKLENRAAQKCYWNTGTLVIRQSMLSGGYDHLVDHFQNAFHFQFGMTSITVEDLYCHNLYQLQINKSPTMTGYHMHQGERGISPNQDVSVTDANASNVVKQVFINTANKTLNIIDPVMVLAKASIQNNQSGAVTNEQFTVNVNVRDSAGTAIQSATVLLEDDADADIFSVSTDASGDIAEQTVTTRSWTGTAETEDDNNPFKLTISKAGYETLVIDNVTIDVPVVWRFELRGVARHKLGSTTYFADDS